MKFMSCLLPFGGLYSSSLRLGQSSEKFENKCRICNKSKACGLAFCVNGYPFGCHSYITDNQYMFVVVPPGIEPGFTV